MNVICLPPNKRHAHVDFLSNILAMATRAVTMEYIQHGFMAPGVIDDTFCRYPDFEKIIGTCNRNPSQREYNLCGESFDKLFDIVLRDGHVSDNVFEECYFPLDIDITGNTSH